MAGDYFYLPHSVLHANTTCMEQFTSVYHWCSSPFTISWRLII